MQFQDPSITCDSQSLHGHSRDELGTLSFVSDFFANLLFVPSPCAAVSTLSHVFFDLLYIRFLPN